MPIMVLKYKKKGGTKKAPPVKALISGGNFS